MSKFILLSLIACIACFVQPVSAIDIVKAGKPVSAVVVPDQYPASVMMAAKELQGIVFKASNARLPIQLESEIDPQKYAGLVYLGNCQKTRAIGIDVQAMGRFEGVVKTVGNNLFIAGRDEEGDVIESCLMGAVTISAGTLFSVYDFLENELGARWLWPGDLGEFVPENSNIDVSGIDRTSKPTLKHSMFRLTKRDIKKSAWNSEYSDAFYDAERLWLCRQRFSMPVNMEIQHSFQSYWRWYGKSHPEFFNELPDGSRRPLPPKGFWEDMKKNDPELYRQYSDSFDQKVPDYPISDYAAVNVTLCVANPDLHQQIVSNYKKLFQGYLARYRKKHGTDPKLDSFARQYTIALCENDSPGMCTCDQCRAWDSPDRAFDEHPYWSKKIFPNVSERFPALATVDGGGIEGKSPSLSDRYAKFYLTVQQIAQEFNPDINVFGYAYANYMDPPKNIKLNERVIISFVGWPMFPYTPTQMSKAREFWDGWRATGASMCLRPNSPHSGHNMPIYYAKTLGNEYRHGYENGMIAVDYDSLHGQWGAQGPSLYVLGRLNVRPDMSVDEILDEYYNAFGSAKDAVKDYFDHWENVSDSVTDEQFKRYKKMRPGGGTWRRWLKIADLVFTQDVMNQGHRLIDRAVVAAGDDEIAKQRVAFLKKGFIDAEMTLRVLVAQMAYEKNSNDSNLKEFNTLKEKLRTYRHSVERDNISDMGYSFYLEKYMYNWWE